MFQHFYDPNEADVAMRNMNGRLYRGKKLKVEKSTSFVRKTPNDGTDFTVCAPSLPGQLPNNN